MNASWTWQRTQFDVRGREAGIPEPFKGGHCVFYGAKINVTHQPVVFVPEKGPELTRIVCGKAAGKYLHALCACAKP
jgi:hypothetical protein